MNTSAMAAEALSKGWRYQQAGDFTRAEQTYRDSLELDDTCAELWHLLGAVRRSLGALSDASECFRRAVSLKPDYSEARNFLAVTLIEVGRLEDGIIELRRAIALRPGDAELRFNLGLALKKQGRTADAIAAWRVVLELKPDHPGAQRGLGEAGVAERRMTQGKRRAGRSRVQPPADPARWEMAEVLSQAWRAHTGGDLKGAEAGYRRALEIDAAQHDVWYLLGAVAQAGGRLDEAVGCFGRAIDLKPDYADAYNYLAVALVAQRKLDEATDAFRRAIDLRPTAVDLRVNLGLALRMSRKHDEALETFRAAMRLKPDDSKAQAMLRRSLRSLGRNDELVEEYRRIAEARSDSPGALHAFGLALMEAKRHEEAVGTFRRALELDPESARLLNNLGLALSGASRPDAGESSPQDFTVTLTPPFGADISRTTATGEIYEDDEPAFSITGGGSATEPTSGTTSLTFMVSVTPPPEPVASVTWGTEDGTALSGTDYISASGVLSFTAGQASSQTVTVYIKDDMWTNESAQDFSVTLSNPSGATLATASAIGTIDEDSDDTMPSVSVSNAQASEQPPEGQEYSELTFNLTLSARSALPVTVGYKTQSAPGDDDATDDYALLGGPSVVFNPGETSTSVAVLVYNDTTVDDATGDPEQSDSEDATNNGQELPTTLSLVLTSATYATIADGTGIGTIYDGEVPDNQPTHCTCACACGNVMPSVNEGDDSLDMGEAPADGATAAALKGPQDTDPGVIITADDQLSQNVAQANDIKVQLTFGARQPQPIYYSAAGYTQGETVVFAQQLTPEQLLGLGDGRYDWTMTITEEYPDSADDVTRTYTGGYNLQNSDFSSFGAGWMPQAVDQLYSTTGGVELADGSGNMYFYANYPLGGYISPANAPNFAQLSQHGDGSYTLIDAQRDTEQFNSSGQLTEKIDQYGNATSYTDLGGLIQTITDQEGRQTTFTYDSADYGGQAMVSAIKDIYGRTTTYTYTLVDGAYRMATITEPAPGDNQPTPSTTFGYYTSGASAGMVATITTADGTTTFDYDPFGEISQITEPDGSVTKYTSPEDQELVPSGEGTSTPNLAPLVNLANVYGTQTDGDNNVTKFTTGLNGLVTSTTDPDGDTTSTLYNAAGQPVQVTAPGLTTGPDAGKPNITTFQYDQNGNLTQEILPDGSTESWSYDPTWNEITSCTDPMGRVTDYQINSTNGEVMSMTQVGANGDANRATSYTYTPAPTAQGQAPGGLLASEVDPRGIETSYTYNTHGLVTGISYAVGTTDAASVSYTYQDDALATEVDEMGRTTSYTIDGLGRTIEVTSPRNAAGESPTTTTRYDALGRVASETVVQSISAGITTEAVTTYAYEPTGDEDAPVTQEIDAAGTTLATTLAYKYDNADNLISESDGMGRVTAFQYDVDNRQTAEQDPSPTDGTNNASFNRATANGPVTSVEYDPLGNVIASFDAATPNPNETDNTYDLRGDLLSSTGPAAVSGGPRPTTGYAYDADQEVVSQVNALGAVAVFKYDEFGELVERDDPSPDGGATPGPVTKYQYDLDGNLTAVTNPNNVTVTYTYNDRDEQVEEIDHAPGGTISYSYDAAMQLVQVTDGAGRITQYKYDGDGNRTATIAPDLSTGLAGNSATTTSDSYDLEGNLISETGPNGATTSNVYDLLNRLIEVIAPVPVSGGTAPTTMYAYDLDGEVTHTTNALNLVQTDSYDGLGRVTSEIGFDGVTTSNSYNSLSQLVESGVTGGGVTADQVTNSYDNLGRLTSSTDGNNGTTKYGYDLLGNRTSLTDSVGNTTSWDLDALGRPTAERLPTGALETFQYDSSGNLLQSVDGDGHIIQYQYNALNEPTSETWLATPAVVGTPPETVQSVVVEHDATAGSWTLSFNGAPATIAYDASAAQVETALDAIPALDGNVDVTGSGTPGDPFVIAFVGALANTPVPLLTANFSGLTVGADYSQKDTGVSLVNSPNSGFSQQQVVGYADTMGYAVTSGDFTVSFEGATASIPYNDSPAQLQAALQSLSTVGSGNVIVTGPAAADGTTGAAFYTISFTGAFAGDAVLPAVTIQPGTLVDSEGLGVSVQSWIVTSPPQAAGPVEPTDAVQQIVVTAASGTFTLGFMGETTSAIPYNAASADVQTALAALPLIGTGNVVVSGLGTWASPFLVSFTGAMAGQPEPALTEADAPTVVNSVTTTYNADSQVATIGDNYSSYAYTYDGEGNVQTVDNKGWSGTAGAVPDVLLTSQYDGMGDRLSLSAAIGGTADFQNTYQYDNLSRLTMVEQQQQTGGNTVAPKEIDYGYNALGQVTSRVAYDYVGVGPRYDIATETISYNTRGLLDGIQMTSQAGAVSLDNLSYSYDTLGRVSSFGSIDGSVSYAYDPTSQLTSATYSAAAGKTEPPNLSVGFDPNGNKTSIDGTSTTVGADNHLTNDGTFTFHYDAAGNLVERLRIVVGDQPDVQTTYAWDDRNRLTDVEFYNASGVLTQHVHYVYDVWNDLIERDLDPNGGGTYTQIVHYVWDGGENGPGEGNIVLAFNGGGSLIARYLNGPNTSAYDQYFTTLAEEDVTSLTSEGTLTFDLQDAQGSVTDVADDNGNLANHIQFDATGAVFSESDPSVLHIGYFQGGYLDPVTGMQEDGVRWEYIADAFWASEDPDGFGAGDPNLTRAVGNDQPNAADPSGNVLVFATRDKARQFTQELAKHGAKNTKTIEVDGAVYVLVSPCDRDAVFKLADAEMRKVFETKHPRPKNILNVTPAEQDAIDKAEEAKREAWEWRNRFILASGVFGQNPAQIFVFGGSSTVPTSAIAAEIDKAGFRKACSPLVIDVGGEGKNKGAININITSKGAGNKDIPNLYIRMSADEQFPIREGSVDTVYIEGTPVEDSVDEIARVTRPGGTIIVEHADDEYGRKAAAAMVDAVGATDVTRENRRLTTPDGSIPLIRTTIKVPN